MIIPVLKIISLYVLLLEKTITVSGEIKKVSEPEDGNLDGPQWSPEEQALYWANLPGKKLHRWDYKTKEISTRETNLGPTSFIIPVKDHPGYVVVSARTSLYLLKWGAPGGDSALRLLTTVDSGMPDNTINDAKADAVGRVWFGTVGKLRLDSPTLAVPDQGTLYCVDHNHIPSPAIKKRPVTVSNGIAFSLDNKKMYYNDSPIRRIVAFDYDLKKGAIANETVVFDFNKYKIPGFPDGMTIDEFGNLWVGTFSKWLLIVDPVNEELLGKLEIPVDRVTSVMWGGPKLDTLFLTTSKLNVTNPKRLSGSVLQITDLEIRGVPEHQFKFPDANTY